MPHIDSRRASRNEGKRIFFRPSVGEQLEAAAKARRSGGGGSKKTQPPPIDLTSLQQHEAREQRLREARLQQPTPPSIPEAPPGPGGGGISSPGGPFGVGGEEGAGPGTPLGALRSTLLGTPSLLRQGLGQRNLPSQTGALAGLRKLF